MVDAGNDRARLLNLAVPRTEREMRSRAMVAENEFCEVGIRHA